MSDDYSRESMLDMYIFETLELIEQLEQLILYCEENKNYNEDTINEIFRIMHTIKGSSAMMFFDNISTLAHSIEDLFFFIRDEKPKIIDYHSLSDLLLQTIDFIKIEINKIKEGHSADGDTEGLIALVSKNLERLKQKNSISNLAPGNEIDMERTTIFCR